MRSKVKTIKLTTRLSLILAVITYLVSAYNNKNCSKALKILISSAISGIIEMHRNTHFSRKTLHLGEYHV